MIVQHPMLRASRLLETTPRDLFLKHKVRWSGPSSSTALQHRTREPSAQPRNLHRRIMRTSQLFEYRTGGFLVYRWMVNGRDPVEVDASQRPGHRDGCVGNRRFEGLTRQDLSFTDAAAVAGGSCGRSNLASELTNRL
jgi:hypothetical protein